RAGGKLSVPAGCIRCDRSAKRLSESNGRRARFLQLEVQPCDAGSQAAGFIVQAHCLCSSSSEWTLTFLPAGRHRDISRTGNRDSVAAQELRRAIPWDDDNASRTL